jgi:hypothetical protein
MLFAVSHNSDSKAQTGKDDGKVVSLPQSLESLPVLVVLPSLQSSLELSLELNVIVPTKVPVQQLEEEEESKKLKEKMQKKEITIKWIGEICKLRLNCFACKLVKPCSVSHFILIKYFINLLKLNISLFIR